MEKWFGSDRDVAHYLLQHNYIKLETHDDVIHPRSMLTADQKGGQLVDEIMRKVEIKPERYHELIDYLRQNAYYEEIVHLLDEEYKKLGSPIPAGIFGSCIMYC